MLYSDTIVPLCMLERLTNAKIHSSNEDHELDVRIVMEGALPPLAHLITSEDRELLELACATLRNLSTAAANDDMMAQEGVIDGLIQALK